MKCPCSCSCAPMMLVLIAIIGIFIYLKFRNNGCCMTSCQKTIQPTKFAIFSIAYPYSLPPLPFAYDALEPNFDTETMTIHHTKHHQAYVDNLNKALKNFPDYHNYSIEKLLTNLDSLPAEIRQQVRNNGGGHFNHMLFWNLLSPQGSNSPTTLITTEITKSFGSFQSFQEQFEKSALGHVGSGWTWLCLTPEKKLTILSTLNHDTPMEKGFFPILVLDIWEHAYYLKFRNKRADFIKIWWNLVNWNYVEKLYNDGIKALS